MPGTRKLSAGLTRRAPLAVRAGAGRKLAGYAAVFNSPAQIGTFQETIAPGAFAASLADPAIDVLALVDHDPSALLGRTSSGTLRLAEDTRGLAFEVDLPDTTLAADLLALAARSDLGGMSFGFNVVRDAWPTPDRRILQAVDLVEISVVRAFPAYADTTVAARSRDAGRDAVRLHLLRLRTLP